MMPVSLHISSQIVNDSRVYVENPRQFDLLLKALKKLQQYAKKEFDLMSFMRFGSIERLKSNIRIKKETP